MKSNQLLSGVKILLLLSFVSILGTSCKKDEGTPKPYVGTWVSLESSTENGATVQMKDQITLTENTFEDLAQMKNPLNDEWIDIMGMKGDLSISGDMMNLIVNDLGYTSFDLTSGMPLGTIVYHQDGESQFSDLLDQLEISRSFSSKFFIVNDKMTIQTDQNEDGDYTDENETTVYTKQ